MNRHRTPSARPPYARLATLVLAIVALFLLALAPTASASKQVVDFFGGTGPQGGQFERAEGVAVNYTGAGGVPPGTIYATDGGGFGHANERGNRVERFQRNDNGTPADPKDDTYSFIAAWGAGVQGAAGSTDFEICTEAANCLPGTAEGGDGSLAGDGSLSAPSGIAVDQETGDVYVLDSSPRSEAPLANFRVNVYTATGAFLRAFGYDVVQSGPDDNGTGYEVCEAGVDICKRGLPGSGPGQIGAFESRGFTASSITVSPPDGNPAAGTVYLADSWNHRVDTYHLDGTAPTSFGSSAVFPPTRRGPPDPTSVAVDSRGIVYASGGPRIERYDSQNADGGGVGFLAPLDGPADEEQRLTITATAGQYRLSFNGHTTSDLAFDASREQVKAALEALSSIGAGNVDVQTSDGTSGHEVYVRFQGALADTDLEQLTASNGTTPLSGGTVTVETTEQGGNGPLLLGRPEALAVQPDSDGPGPETDVLYVREEESPISPIRQFGPLDQPGLTAPPTASDDTHSTVSPFSYSSIALEPPTGRIYAAGGTQELGQGVFVLDTANATPPTGSLDSLSAATAHGFTAHATINPKGLPDTSYRFEYVDDATYQADLAAHGAGHGFDHAASTATEDLGHQESPQSITETIEPPGAGLRPNTTYHVRLLFQRRFALPLTTSELTTATLAVPPLVETTGSPLRTATTATLLGRLDPNDKATTYHFEYGDQGPCDSNPCLSTPDLPAGSGDEVEFASARLTELQPATTYHYRLLADNGAPGSPAAGADITLTTRASDAPLTRDTHLPGPPGSDRAYELVSMSDAGGNPVNGAEDFSPNGDRAIYTLLGGAPISTAGTFITPYFSQRQETAPHQGSWQASVITPPRNQEFNGPWSDPVGAPDLSSLVSHQNDGAGRAGDFWSLSPDHPPVLLFAAAEPQESVLQVLLRGYLGTSADASVVVAAIKGPGLDPAYPAAAAAANLYRLAPGHSPRLLSLLPGNVVSPCGFEESREGDNALPSQQSHWVSADGAHVYFLSRGDDCSAPGQLYVRDLAAEQTRLISGPPLAGPSCAPILIDTSSSAAYFWTSADLSTADAPSDCTQGGDVYRYELATESLDCLTCLVPGLPARISTVSANTASLALSPDASRLYFVSRSRLLPGAPAGTNAIYRLDTATGGLAYVAPLEPNKSVPDRPSQPLSQILSPDGRFFIFSSSSSALNPLGGASDNGATSQVYLYDDARRSLLCASCPSDGSPPLQRLSEEPYVASNGTVAFSTATPLVAADQNTPTAGDLTPGNDVYEFRDGRQLLVTDGLTNWDAVPPSPFYLTPSGRDLFFEAAAAYTPDALDNFTRLYDARIGGGFEFPPPPKPCALEVCQGTPKGAPEEQPPGTSNFRGPGNEETPRPCRKGKVRRHGKCAPKHHKKRHKRAHHRAAGPNQGASR